MKKLSHKDSIRKLVVRPETLRQLSEQQLVTIAGGRFPYSAASHQDVCCA